MARALSACRAFWLILAAGLHVSAATAESVSQTAPIVDLGYAQYQGYFDAQTNTTQFLGIRYAAPPVGNLRFQAPRPPAPESGIQLAMQNPTACYQAGIGTNTTLVASSHQHDKRQRTPLAVSEDCLFLNVFVPGTIASKPNPSGKHPVVVWIHGGGYELGYAAQYNGAHLVVSSLNSVVVVVIQYRLGLFGFLSGNEVKAQGTLNAGLLDQDFALKWVQNHIGSFNGNKDHVTIWGESAGAGSVLQHVVANGGNTHPALFNAAITSSLFFPSQYHYNDRVPQLLYDEIVAMTKCASGADTFTCLQSVEPETLQAANYDLVASGFYGTFAFVPVVDGTFIRARPTVTLAEGNVNGRVLLSVTNQNEGDIFVDANDTLLITDYLSRLFPDLTPPQVTEAASLYQDHGTPLEQAIAVMGDSTFVCPTHYLLKAFTGRSWKGLFAIPPAYHGSDIQYYFYSPATPPVYDNTQFISTFSQSFLSLVKYYDVNKKFDKTNIAPKWAKYDTQNTEMVFNHTEEGVPAVHPIHTDPSVLQRCAFWKKVTCETKQ